MVFFTCNACGESMKKNQVEKHYKFQCKRCEYLSCVDCSQEFWGDEYAKHTKCITEDAKYGGKDYKPKPNANKGERKQEEWIEKVQNAIDNCKSNPKLKGLLEKMKDYSNIPRKKAKFENFVKNSLRIQTGLATQMWDAISVEVNNTKTNSEVNGIVKTADGENKSNDSNCNLELNGQISDTVTDDQKKLNKRERKEERKKNKNKTEKKDKKLVPEEVEENNDSKKKKKKKRKHEEVKEEEENERIAEEEVQQKKNKKKRKRDEDSEPVKKKSKKEVTAEEDIPEINNESVDMKKSKFDWEGIIVGLLKKSEGNQLSIKKLRKKVLAEFFACHVEPQYTEEKAHAKFNKKLNNNKRFKVLKEKVTLKS